MAANMSFTDEDLDETEIGGNLTWHPPYDTSEVTDACHSPGPTYSFLKQGHPDIDPKIV